MKVLVVGGTGLVGGWTALELQRRGYDVSIFARRPPPPESPMASIPFIQGDYFSDTNSPAALEGFDGLVFSACSDIRHMPQNGDVPEFFRRANIDGVPAFMQIARKAGIRRTVYIGTLYASLLPSGLAQNDPYVSSRIAVDKTLRSMATPDFGIVTIDIPYAIGAMPGLIPNVFRPIADWALGRLPEVPLVAPGGGSNFMSLRSVAHAVEGAISGKGENGQAYLIGDQNISFQELCRMFFLAAGRNEELPVTSEEHPLLPDAMLPAGRGGWLRFEPKAANLFQYERNDVQYAVRQVVEQAAKT